MIFALIRVPTAPWAHTLFDLVAWSAGATVGYALYRWRLKDRLRTVAGAVGPGYFVSLGVGAAAGAWLSGSLNTLRQAAPALSHSVAGALVGAIVAVELYKAARGIRGSTGGIFVGSFATGILIGRWGCLFAGLPDRTFGAPTALPWGSSTSATGSPAIRCRSTRASPWRRSWRSTSPGSACARRGRCGAASMRCRSGTAPSASPGSS